MIKSKTLSNTKNNGIPYSTRAKILTPILNKLIDEKDMLRITEAYNEEREDIKNKLWRILYIADSI